MSILSKKKLNDIDVLAGIQGPKENIPLLQRFPSGFPKVSPPPDLAPVAAVDVNLPPTRLTPQAKILTDPKVSAVIDFLAGDQTVPEADISAFEHAGRVSQIPKQISDIGKFAVKPLLPPRFGGRPNTFTDFARMVQESLFPVISAPFVPAAGAITSAIHPGEDTTLPSRLKAAVGGLIRPETAPPLFKGITAKKIAESLEDVLGTGFPKAVPGAKEAPKPSFEVLKGIESGKPLTKFEREGGTGRLIPRATLQAAETVALGYMLGVPRAIKSKISKRVKAIKDAGAIRDFETDFAKVDPKVVQAQIQKQGLFPKKATPFEKADFTTAVMARLKAELRRDPRVGSIYAAKQEVFKTPAEALKSEAGQLKFSPTEKTNVPLKSNLQAVADAKIPNKVAAGQAMNTIRNAGVSKEEIEFSGVEKFLEGKKSVTKQELLDHIDKNKVRVETTVKGDSGLVERRQEVLNEVAFELFISDWDELTNDQKAEAEQYLADENIDAVPKPGETKFESYTLPGGENYQEVLIKIPDIIPDKYEVRIRGTNELISTHDTELEAHKVWVQNRSRNAVIVPPKASTALRTGFQSSHWPEDPNTVVHLRKNDRTDADGKKVFFIEEIQSDWHLQGKKKGYSKGEGEIKIKTIEEDMQGFAVLFTDGSSSYVGKGAVPGGENATEQDVRNYYRNILVDKNKLATGEVPDAPFKNSWHELALKKAIEMAVKGGYDKVVWVSGQQTADRYDLSAKVENIVHRKLQDGTYDIRILLKTGSDLTKVLPENEIEGFVGKDIAQKIIKGEGKDAPADASFKRLESVDLVVGGQWAKTFYDKILPQTANKYIKKWGGKVEEVTLEEGLKKATLIDKDDGSTNMPFQVLFKDTDGTDSINTFRTKKERQAFLDSKNILNQQGFIITPQMIKEVTEVGQPIFGTRLVGVGFEKLAEQRGMAGPEGVEPLPDDLEVESPEIFKDIEPEPSFVAVPKKQPAGKIPGKPPEPPKKTGPPEPEEFDEWDEPDAELTEKIKDMEVKKITSREKAGLDAMTRDVESDLPNLSKAVKAIGGIKPFANRKEFEEYKAIPKKFRSSKGMTLDDAVSEINNQGFNFEDGEALRQALIDEKFMRQPPISMSGELGNLVEQYEIIKDIWQGNQDVRITLEIPAELRKMQNSVKTLTGAKKYGEKEIEIDEAIKLYIDNKIDQKQVSELYPSLPKEKRDIIDRSRNLSPEAIKLAEALERSEEALGIEAKGAEIIQNVQENHVNRAWDIEGKVGGEKFRKFGTTTGHAKARVFKTIAEGWSKGFEMKVKGATTSLALLKEELVKTIEDKKFIKELEQVKDLEGNPELTTQQLPGYERVNHPNFKKWKHVGKVEKGKIYGRNTFIDDKGNVFQKVELYAPAHQARNMNNILGISKLKGVPGFDVTTKYNAILKAWILQTSLFHHLAFTRSYYLGTNRKTFKEMNLIDAVNEGNRMIDEMRPLAVHLVRNGLTIGRKQDWQEDLLREKTAIGEVLDKWKVSKITKDKILELRQRQADFLFGVMGAGLKMKSAAIEYRNQSKKFPNEDPNVLAKRVANLINDDFGGLHLKRLGRNPTLQHIFRLLALAPDWTESNIRTMVIALTPTKVTWDPTAKKFRWTDEEKKDWRKDEAEMYRNFWGGIFAKGVTATLLANLAMAAFDDDDVSGKGTLEKFARNYNTAWRAGKYRWLDVDVTPIYKAIVRASGGTPDDERRFFSILGHFKDPLKLSIRNDSVKKGQRSSTFNLGNMRAMKHKSSVVGGMATDYITGTDYAERRFTTFKELIGRDFDKGEYKTTRKGMYKKGDPKWGKLTGKTVTWRPGKRGIVEFEEMPSYLINQIKGSQPVQVQNLIGMWAGELDRFIGIGNMFGLGISKTYGNEPEEISKKKWFKVPLDEKRIDRGSRYVKEDGVWRKVLVIGMAVPSTKKKEETKSKPAVKPKNRISANLFKQIDALAK